MLHLTHKVESEFSCSKKKKKLLTQRASSISIYCFCRTSSKHALQIHSFLFFGLFIWPAPFTVATHVELGYAGPTIWWSFPSLPAQFSNCLLLMELMERSPSLPQLGSIFNAWRDYRLFIIDERAPHTYIRTHKLLLTLRIGSMGLGSH